MALINIYRFNICRLSVWRIGQLGVCGILALILSACSQSQNTYPVLDGDDLVWEDLQGKAVFINYWAEWCKPCREEIPELNAFAKAHRQELVVLSVNFDGMSGEVLRNQVKSLGVEFPTLLRDPRVALGVKPSGGLPETIVLDRSGRVFRVLLGPQTEQSLNGVLSELDL